MKEIKAIIQSFMAEKVLDALHQIPNAPGVTVSEVRGYGKHPSTGLAARESEGDVFGEKKIKLELVVPDHLVEQVAQTIARSAHTGHPGDGKIFIYNVDDVVKIRTGERGERAI